MNCMRSVSEMFIEYEKNTSNVTKTICEVLNIDGLSEELKRELRKHPEDYFVWIIEGENRIVVSPPNKKLINL